MLQQQIKGELKAAMIAKDEIKLGVIRGLMTAFTNELISKGKSASDEMSDDDALAVVKRAVKQRKDAIEQFTKGARADLAAAESKELALLEGYLPQMMSLAEIRKIATAKKAEMGVTDKAKSGQFMGALMKDLKGKADGGDVKKVVEELFA